MKDEYGSGNEKTTFDFPDPMVNNFTQQLKVIKPLSKFIYVQKGKTCLFSEQLFSRSINQKKLKVVIITQQEEKVKIG